MTDRDKWSKAEILGKIAGAIFVPVAIAAVGLVWNARIQSEQIASARIELSMAILQSSPLPDGADSRLRAWASSTLQTPTDPPAFPDNVDLSQTFVGQQSVICEVSAPIVDRLTNALLVDQRTISDDVGIPAVELIVLLDGACS